MPKVRKFGNGAAVACIGLAPCLGMAVPADYYECPGHIFSNSLSEAEAAARNCVGRQIAPDVKAAAQAKQLYRCPSANWPSKRTYVDGLTQADAASRNCTALDSDWQYYGLSADGTKYEYNAHRLEFGPSDATVGIWLRVTSTKPGTLTFPSGRKVNFHYFIAKGTAYCTQHTFADGIRYYYEGSGIVWTDTSYKPALPLPPDSDLDALTRELCTDYVAN